MLKKLKSLFIVEEGNAPKKQAPTTEEEVKLEVSESELAKANELLEPSKPSAAVPKADGKPNEKFVDKLLGAIEANNLDGFDYLEFKQSLQSLNKMDMDEATRYQSAMAMAKTMGASEDKILNAAEHYLNILKDEQQKFEVAFKNQESKQITLREQKIKDSEAAIKQKTARIEELKKEIDAAEKQLEVEKQNANQANAKVQATKQGFYNAYHSVVNQIKADVSAIQQYLL